jgi:hypothetical protein
MPWKSHVFSATFARVAIIGALALTACGSVSAGGASTKSAQSPAGSAQSHDPRLFNSDTSGKGSGLLIVTKGSRCGSYLVLDRTTGAFDSATIAKMAAYTLPDSKYYVNDPDFTSSRGVKRGGQQYYHTLSEFGDPGIDETPPEPLQWVAGGPNCFAKLEITNTGSSVIQIPSMGVTLSSDAVRNTYTYNLLNVCSVQKDRQCHPDYQGHGGVDTCPYYADITQAGGKAGTHVEAPLTPGDDPTCSRTLTLQPGDVAKVFPTFSSLPWLYHAKLTFGVRSSAGADRLVFSSLQQNLAFVDDSTVFNCYGLNGSTFVREAPSSHVDERFHVCV